MHTALISPHLLAQNYHLNLKNKTNVCIIVLLNRLQMVLIRRDSKRHTKSNLSPSIRVFYRLMYVTKNVEAKNIHVIITWKKDLQPMNFELAGVQLSH